MARGAVAALVLAAGCATARPAGEPAAEPAAEPAPAIAAARHRALLVSFDSFNERRALETLPPDAIPAIRALFANGACADHALPAWPSKTAASHASLWTGAYGDVNGIAANNQPPLPRDRHRITERVSGYSSARLRAEPIWVTAALAGRSVVGHHPTQAPGAPGYPAVEGSRDSAHAGAYAAAVRALEAPDAVVMNGYNRHYASNLALTAASAPPHPAIGWRGLERLGTTLPPREIAWTVGGDSIFAVFYGRDRGSGRYTHVLVAPVRDAARGVTAAAAPAERDSPRGRPLARHFSEPLELPVDVVPGGSVYLRVRLFALEPDASDFLLFQPALQVVEANHPEAAAAYARAIGGWTGNGAQDLLLDGALGRTLQDGGDGEAELRYLESLEYTTRQFMRGSEWAWARRPDLQVDYFPVADEVDHMWYGYVVSGTPAFRPGLAQAIQEMRVRAWTLVDLRLAALRRLVAGDSTAALFVSGDHGMRATWRTFRPNVALAEAGLLAVDDSGRVDVTRTRALAPDGLYIMVNTTAWDDGIVPPDSAAAVLATAERAIRAVRGRDGAPVVTRTWLLGGDSADESMRDSLGRGGPVGGALYWESAPGYDWDRRPTGEATTDGRVGAEHGFPSISPDMYTVLCGESAAFRAGRIGPARTIDAAPTVAAWLGIPPPRFARGRALVAKMLIAPSSPPAVRHGVGTWNPDSLGNHRAVLRVERDAAVAGGAVSAHIPWRRRDTLPERKRIIVTDSAGRRIANAVALRVTRAAGDLAFQPAAGAGTYYVYYMPYQGSVRSNYPKITYQPPDSTADAAWLRGLARSRPPAAELVELQAVDSMSLMDPMEVIATAEETAALRARQGGAAFVVFPEDRTRAIRMTGDLPQDWIAPGRANGPVTGEAQRGEFYAFQLGVWALRSLDSVTVRFAELRGPAGAVIPAAAFSSFTTGGVDWQGRTFARRVQVPQGVVHPLWAGVMLPDSAAPGAYEGSVSVSAAGVAPVVLPVRLTVAPTVIANHGDDEPWRLSRLRWLDSRSRLDTTLVPPYTPVRVRGTTLGILGREIALAPTGLPAQIRSFFTKEMTAIGREARPLLAAPLRFVAEDSSGRPLAWRGGGVRMTRQLPGAALWEATSRAGALAMTARAQLDFDGNVEYAIAVTADSATTLRDLRLEIPLRRDVARYLMGMNHKGGAAPASYDWTWDVKRNQDAAWIGDVNAGLQFTLRDERYVRPLNTNFYQLRPLVMPRSWENGGRGGCRFRAEGGADGGADGDVYRVSCYGGARTVAPGDTLRFDLRLLVTPFHPIDTRTHFAQRYFHRYAPVDTIRSVGANVVNVHHATAVNPYINYPFLRPAAMKAYADSLHAAGMRLKIYYTVRELTNRTPELWALRTLGDEVLASGPGGGHSWLQEHVVHDYIPGWVVPEIRDVALVTSGISRWHNFYVEGLQWLAEHVGIDGLYLDDVAFDRTTMQRIRRVLASRGNGPGERIDLHSANQFNPNDGFASSANLYLEHFPYIDRLWFGEYFDYDSPPDYWLTEISGIPFGLMGEMLQDGGNPWRGMLFGMTNRLPWTGADPRPVWKLWDDFGIAEARMVGWWSSDAPVRTGRPDVLATTYLGRDGRALVAVASWAKDTVSVPLEIDWRALGLDPSRVRVRAPAMPGIQDEVVLRPGEALPVAPGKGWMLVAEPR